MFNILKLSSIFNINLSLKCPAAIVKKVYQHQYIKTEYTLMSHNINIAEQYSAERPWILVFTWTAIGTNNFVI